MPRVFLSHSSHDKVVVEQIARDLTGAEIDVWFDDWEILVGHSIPEEIEKGLRASDFVVLFLSEQAVRSGWVRKEWEPELVEEVESKGVRLLPALLSNCDVPRLLRQKRSADFRTDHRAGMSDLIKAIQKHSPRPRIPPEYLDWLWRRCASVELLGQDMRQGQAITLNLVYVPALTQPAASDKPDDGSTRRRGRGKLRAMGEEEKQPTTLLARLDEASLFVPAPAGAGKSTFCRWAALRCHPDAPTSHPVPPPEGFEEPVPSNLRTRLPLLIPLREFARAMDCGQGRRSWNHGGLERALAAWVDAEQPPGLSGTLLRAHLRAGNAFLLLDGLDEVPPSETRDGATVYPRELLLSGLADALPAWEKAGNRTLLTSRPYGLDEGWLARLGLARAPLEPLPEPLQKLFVTRWFHTLGKEELARQLLAAMPDRPDLAPLVETPLLLTAVCVLYDNGGRLPEDRYELYKSIVSLVLHSRYPGDAREREPVLRRLEAIAYGMHTGEPDGPKRKTPASEISWIEAERLLAHFANVNPSYEAGQVEPAVQREELLHRSGLLIPREGDRAAFYHLSLQEFLAAQRMVRISNDLDQVFRTRATVPEWRLTLLFLFAAQIAARDPEWGLELLMRLLAKQEPLSRRSNPALAVFVAEALDLCLAKGYRIPPPLAGQLRDLAVGAIENEVKLQARQTLGLILGQLRDPRIRDLRDPDAYVEVPAGIYPFGEEGGTVGIDAPFQLARYPVTNSQYRSFMEAGGYTKRRWWSEAGRAWLEKEKVTEPRYWHDRRFNAPNQPVVGISFFEAEAFAASAGGRLPTEQEWEAAARGAEGREYPWGERWQDGICNTAEAGLGLTSPVGLFPRAKTPEGLEDMAGNVWEWCQSLYYEEEGGEPDAARVLRGGSWGYDQDGARCAVRVGIYPDNRDNYFGFRVVCSSPIENR